MTPIHAPDAMGKAAHKAATLVSRLDFHLLLASSPNTTREQRADALMWAFKRWRPICEAMAELEASAPNAAAAGYAEHAKLQDFIEGRAAG